MIVITVRGGVVQHIRSDERETRVLVVDHDYDDDHGPYVSLEDAEYSPEEVGKPWLTTPFYRPNKLTGWSNHANKEANLWLFNVQAASKRLTSRSG